MPSASPKWYESRAGIEAISAFILVVVGNFAAFMYSDRSIGDREVALLLGSTIASYGVYYVRHGGRHQGRFDAIADLLLVSSAALGPSYRVNLMRLTKDDDEAQRTFGFICHANMRDLHKYRKKIRLTTPGVGTAYMNPSNPVYLGPNEVDGKVDEYPSHVWSIAVESTGLPRCVLNIDTNAKSLAAEQIKHVQEFLKALAPQIAKHSPGRLKFIE